MNAADCLLAVLWLQLDDAHSTEVGAHIGDVVLECGGELGVRGPQSVFVGLALVPKATAVEFAIGRSKRSKVGVAAALPIEILKRLVLDSRNLKRCWRQLNKTGGIKCRQPRMRSVQRNAD